MKIMRRVVRAVWVGDPVGDLSGLVNPEAVATARPRRAGQAAHPDSIEEDLP
jgi:acetyl-CoA synthetase